jgi:Fe-S-cluster-containing dehydrogenase component/DMSO reductase anchor subunit
MPLEFVFDTNKCTGCHACAVACIIENQVDLENSWRSVITYNSEHYPHLPNYHLSMACNHCDDAPCLKYCPALAYKKDAGTGSIILSEEKCMGCKYCTWVCPYDAPKFNVQQGIVEKCTFCTHRLEDSRDPACVALCPTAALTLGERITKTDLSPIAGFSDYCISPGISVIPLEPDNKLPVMSSTDVVDPEILALLNIQASITRPKMDLRNEWALLILSVVAPFIVALYTSGFFLDNVRDILPISILASLVSIVLSTGHLGKKRNAYRAIFNMRYSWLSREIGLFSLFIMLMILHYFDLINGTVPGVLTIICGVFLLISMDGVYHVIPKIQPLNLHSANVMLSGLFWFGVLTDNIYIIAMIGMLRIFLYLSQQERHSIYIYIRLISGYIVPLTYVIIQSSLTFIIAISAVVLGELIDRVQFYNSFKIITPQQQMQIDQRINQRSVFEGLRADSSELL